MPLKKLDKCCQRENKIIFLTPLADKFVCFKQKLNFDFFFLKTRQLFFNCLKNWVYQSKFQLDPLNPALAQPKRWCSGRGFPPTPEGALEAWTPGGALEARTPGGALEARTLGGALEARTLGGALEARTLGGALEARALGRSGNTDSWGRSGSADTWGRSGTTDTWGSSAAGNKEHRNDD